MDDMTAFERQLAARLERKAGPRRAVDALAIARSATASRSPTGRFQTMFSATKFVVAGVIVALFGGFLLTSVMTQPRDDSRAPVGAQASRPLSTATAGCDQPLIEPGDYEGTYDVVDDVGQEYRVVVPEGYAELAPVPLILQVGYGGADTNYEWWRPYLDEIESLFVIADTSTGAAPASTLLALIDQVGADYCIDPRRIHAMGASLSAPTVTRLACEASDRIASFVIGIGGFRIECEPERPVPLLAVTGDPDRVFMSSSVGWWAEMAGCQAGPVVEDLGSGVSRQTYQGCAADVLFYDIEGGGHQAFFHECIGYARAPLGGSFCHANEAIDQLEEAERFFAEHPLSE